MSVKVQNRCPARLRVIRVKIFKQVHLAESRLKLPQKHKKPSNTGLSIISKIRFFYVFNYILA